MKKMIASLMILGTLTLSANTFANELPYEQEDDGGNGSPSGTILTTDDGASDPAGDKNSDPVADESLVRQVLDALGDIAQIVDAFPAFRSTTD